MNPERAKQATDRVMAIFREKRRELTATVWGLRQIRNNGDGTVTLGLLYRDHATPGRPVLAFSSSVLVQQYADSHRCVFGMPIREAWEITTMARCELLEEIGRVPWRLDGVPQGAFAAEEAEAHDA